MPDVIAVATTLGLPDPSVHSRRCAFVDCDRPDAPTKACAGCGFISLCGRDHQRACMLAWLSMRLTSAQRVGATSAFVLVPPPRASALTARCTRDLGDALKPEN